MIHHRSVPTPNLGKTEEWKHPCPNDSHWCTCWSCLCCWCWSWLPFLPSSGLRILLWVESWWEMSWKTLFFFSLYIIYYYKLGLGRYCLSKKVPSHNTAVAPIVKGNKIIKNLILRYIMTLRNLNVFYNLQWCFSWNAIN